MTFPLFQARFPCFLSDRSIPFFVKLVAFAAAHIPAGGLICFAWIFEKFLPKFVLEDESCRLVSRHNLRTRGWAPTTRFHLIGLSYCGFLPLLHLQQVARISAMVYHNCRSSSLLVQLRQVFRIKILNYSLILGFYIYHSLISILLAYLITNYLAKDNIAVVLAHVCFLVGLISKRP